MYIVNYHTGAGNTKAETIDEAMALADEGASYTQEKITIEDESGNVEATRYWYGVALDQDEDETPEDEFETNPICFGDFGYYADWTF